MRNGCSHLRFGVGRAVSQQTGVQVKYVAREFGELTAGNRIGTRTVEHAVGALLADAKHDLTAFQCE